MTTNASYELILVDGRQVPAVWREVVAGNGDRIRSFWTGGRVTLHPEGGYTVGLRSALEVRDRTDPLSALLTGGTWREASDGVLELRSDRGVTSRWQISRDRSVLVACALHAEGDRPENRTTFVFQRERSGSRPDGTT